MIFRYFGLQSYKNIFQSMKNFTNTRDKNTIDEIWMVEHFPIFTQGQKGRIEHILNPGSIPVIQSDRGGQVTYHGPGQQVVYMLLDLKRWNLGVRNFIFLLEKIVINTLIEFKISAHSHFNAPGVYVGDKKICSIGLRIQKGCSFHGLSLNINMDLSPFLRINPCGLIGIKMTQMAYWNSTITTDIVRPKLIRNILKEFNNPVYYFISQINNNKVFNYH